jgi:hypothetical protein
VTGAEAVPGQAPGGAGAALAYAAGIAAARTMLALEDSAAL